MTDRLQTKTHAKHAGPPLGESGHDGAQDACIFWPAWPRREQDGIRLDRERFIDRDLIVAHHNRVGPELTEVLHEVVDKAVVAVDDQDPL